MNAGDFLRGLSQRPDAAALLGVQEICRLRRSMRLEAPWRGRAFLLRSLMRPEEVETLRKIYGSQSFLVSVFSPAEARERALARKLASAGADSEELMRAHAIGLMNRDIGIMRRDEEAAAAIPAPFRLDVRKTFERADLFVSVTDPEESRNAVRRFVELIFGHPFETPTRDEYGMAIAYATSLRSAALSRRVGACLLGQDGEVLATGTNEVPRYGGGLYSSGDIPDGRDFQLREDSSDRIRREILADVVRRLLADPNWISALGAIPAQHPVSETTLEQATAAALRSNALRDARALDVVEYSRVVHAEMATLTSAARRGVATQGSTLYCSTFPCHECARHVVAAGVVRVVYVEPYPKSRVAELFGDSIGLADRRLEIGNRVRFEPFIGIAPRRFAELFAWVSRKQGDVDPEEPWLSGRTVEWSLATSKLRPSILDPEANESGARRRAIETSEEYFVNAFNERLEAVERDRKDLTQPPEQVG